MEFLSLSPIYLNLITNYIYNFNLISQQYQNNIPFEDHGFLNNILLINDTILSILPGRFAKYGYLFFNQTISGRIVGGIAKEDITHPGTWAGRNPLFRLSSDNSILFQPSESDTIFRITGAKMTPVYSFIFEKPQKNGYKTTGSNVLYLHSDEKQFLFSKIGFESEIAPDHSSFNFISNDQLSYNTKTKRISKISSVLMGSMGLQLENDYLIFSEKNRVFIPLQAAYFKKNLEKSIKKDGITLDNKEKLIKLNNEITDTDNPIIITGIWK